MICASCHCGAVTLEISRRPRQLTECNCSICRRYGTLWAYYTHRTVRISDPGHALKAYSWGDKRLNFHHCGQCGCITHHERTRKRGNSTVAINARLLEPDVIASTRIRKLDGAATWKYIS